jgi:hypothetical protein
LRPKRISAQSIWENIQLFSVTSKFVLFPSKLFRQLVYMWQNLAGMSWGGMLSNFKTLVSRLYRKWEDCLMQSLRPQEKTYFESICLKTATDGDWPRSLYLLTYFLRQKFGRKVIVLIDEHEAPINWAYEFRYFKEVRPLYPSITIKVKNTYSSNPGQCVFLAGRASCPLEGDHYEISLQII